MRICHISTRLILGGSQENTVLSCEGQARMGHEVHLAFGPIYGPEGSMLDRVRAFRTDDDRVIHTHEVPDLIREIHPLRDARALAHLTRLIHELDPDIVHTHSSKAGILGRLAAWHVRKRRVTRPAIVHTIHGPPFHRYLPRRTNTLYVLAERIAARRCDRIVAVADAMTRQFLEHRIGRPQQYTTVRSGMEIEPFLHARDTRDHERRALGLEPDDFAIATVARLAELKGHDDLLDALAEDLRTDPHLKLLWIGDGWWRDRLLVRARDLRIEQSVITTGLVAPERIAPLLGAADLLVHPSYREGLPRAVTQAMLAGLPVIATDIDGTPEICIHEETGLLYRPGDTTRLRDLVRTARADPTLRERLAGAARDRATREFSAAKMVEDLERVYGEAIELAKGGAGGRADAPDPAAERPDP